MAVHRHPVKARESGMPVSPSGMIPVQCLVFRDFSTQSQVGGKPHGGLLLR
jgi:hypothetical protein